VRVSGKRLLDVNAGNFPMSGGAVLPRRSGIHQTPCASRLASGVRAFERHNVSEPALRQVGKIEAPNSRRDVAECVTPGVAICFRVRRRAGTDTIEDDYRGAFQLILRSNSDRVANEVR
jgi:hypothetical protein